MTRMRMVLVLAMLLSLMAGIVAPERQVLAANPFPLSLGAVTLSPNPLLRTNPTVSVSVPATVTWDSGSSTTNEGNCKGNKITGYERTDKTTVVTISDKALAVSASDGSNFAWLSGSAPDSGTYVYVGPLPAPSTDGKTTVSASATATETVTTRVDTTVTSWPASALGCTGSPSSSSTTPGTPSSTQKISTAAASGSYVTDVVPPSVSVKVHPNPQIIYQGQHVVVGLDIDDGSAGTAYTWSVSLSGPAAMTSPTYNGKFGPSSPSGSGIAPHEAAVATVATDCTTPPGTYSVSVQVNAVDLGGNSWGLDPIDAGTVQVLAAVSLESQAIVVAQLASGDYDLVPSFTASTTNNKVATNPGSFHNGVIITLGGACASTASASALTATITLPDDFSYLLTGRSPQAHVFLGSNIGGFDLHTPSNMTEVSPKVTVDGKTIRLDLSKLPAVTNPTIYIRAHNTFTGTPAPNKVESFPTTTGGNILFADGSTVPTFSSSNYSMVENP